jgi:hypothetical protein
MPTLLAGILVMVLSAGLSIAGFLAVSKYVPDKWLVADADAASALYATIGMVYAILIAIAAIAVWEPHDDAKQAAQQEAADLSESYWLAGQLSAPSSTQIRDLIVRYDRSVVNKEWPALKETHKGDQMTAELFDQLRTAAATVQPATDAQQSAEDDLLDRLEDAADARRSRLTAADQSMPPMLWPTLILGAVVSIAFLYVFGLDRTFPNGVMMATVAAMTALVLFVIYEVEFPYSRGLSVGPEAFTTALTTFTGST